MEATEDKSEDGVMFRSASQFSMYIEGVARDKRMSHMDVVLKYCHDNFVEPEDIKHLINKSLKDKIEVDMIRENMLPKRATLNLE